MFLYFASPTNLQVFAIPTMTGQAYRFTILIFVEMEPLLLGRGACFQKLPEFHAMLELRGFLEQGVHIDQESRIARTSPGEGLKLAVQQNQPRQPDDVAVVLIEPVESGPQARFAVGIRAARHSRGSRRYPAQPRGVPPTSARVM